MKYLLIILLFACSQPSRHGKNVVVIDSLPIVEGTMSERTRDSIRATFTEPGSFTGLKYYRMRISTDAGTLGYEQDGTITITGDTMSVIRSILGTIDQKSKWYTELYKENQELRRLIEGLIKQQNEIQYTRFTTDL